MVQIDGDDTMSNATDADVCQKCGAARGSGKRSDRIIVLTPVKGRLLCQNCRPKPKKVEVTPDTTQLLFEEKGN
jgi:hypothetical protein